MPYYEYKCWECGTRRDSVHSMGFAPPAVECAECGGRAHRLFTVGCIKTDTNNPLRGLGRRIRGDTSSRAAAAATFERRGLVMADGRDCDLAERQAGQERRELATKAEDGIREYNRLPLEMRQRDAAKVAKEEKAKAEAVTATAIRG